MPAASQKNTAARRAEWLQEKRSQMLGKGLTAFDELFQIAESEIVANQSRYRMQAYMVMAKFSVLNALLLRDA